MAASCCTASVSSYRANGASVSSWSSRHTQSPVANPTAALLLPAMPRLRSRNWTFARGSAAANFSRIGRTCGAVLASAKHNCQCGYVCAATDASIACRYSAGGLNTGTTTETVGVRSNFRFRWASNSAAVGSCAAIHRLYSSGGVAVIVCRCSGVGPLRAARRRNSHLPTPIARLASARSHRRRRVCRGARRFATLCMKWANWYALPACKSASSTVRRSSSSVRRARAASSWSMRRRARTSSVAGSGMGVLGQTVPTPYPNSARTERGRERWAEWGRPSRAVVLH